MWAILLRELRAQVRRSTVHRMRMAFALTALAGLAVLLTVTVSVWTGAGFVSTRMKGGEVFGWLGRITAVLAMVAMPLLTVDSLSRERREGTLPLLFLTPLRPPAVVFGKAIHGLVQAALLFLGVVPVLTVPILAGGVSVAQLTSSLLMVATLTVVGLSAGTLASSVGERPGRVMALAYLVEMAVLLGIGLVALGLSDGPSAARWWLSHPEAWIVRSGDLWDGLTFAPVSRFPGAGAAGPPPFRGGGAGPLFPAVGWMLTGALAVWVPVVLLAARAVRRASVIEPPPPEREARRRVWTEARLFLTSFRRLQRRNLERNPLLWLQRRTPGLSMQRLAWLGVTALLWSNVISGIGWLTWGFRAVVYVIPALLAVGMVFQAAGVFRAEREAGSIELLLVTGLTETQILRGALRASIGTFLPAVLLHAGVNFALQDFWRLGEFPTLVLPLLTSTGVLPLVGLDHALRDGRYFRGLVRVAVAGLVVPALGAVAVIIAIAWIKGGVVLSAVVPSPFPVYSGIQVFIGFLAWRRARRCLVDRAFLSVRVGG